MSSKEFDINKIKRACALVKNDPIHIEAVDDEFQIKYGDKKLKLESASFGDLASDKSTIFHMTDDIVCGWVASFAYKADADFYVIARNILLDAIDEIERLQAKNARLQERWEKFTYKTKSPDTVAVQKALDTIAYLKEENERLVNAVNRMNAHFGNPCKYCGETQDKANPSPCQSSRISIACQRDALKADSEPTAPTMDMLKEPGWYFYRIKIQLGKTEKEWSEPLPGRSDGKYFKPIDTHHPGFWLDDCRKDYQIYPRLRTNKCK